MGVGLLFVFFPKPRSRAEGLGCFLEEATIVAAVNRESAGCYFGEANFQWERACLRGDRSGVFLTHTHGKID